MCGYCPGATIGEARAFYEAVRKGTVTKSMALKMASHATRLSLPERQRAEMLEDPTLFEGKPDFKNEVQILLDAWDAGDKSMEAVSVFERVLVQLRRTYDEVHVGHDFDELVASAPEASQVVLAKVPDVSLDAHRYANV